MRPARLRERAGLWLDYFFLNAFTSFVASSKHLGSNASITIKFIIFVINTGLKESQRW